MAESKLLQKRAKAPVKSVSLAVQEPDAKSVIVTGDFTRWSDEGIALSKGSDGEWTTSLNLAPGEYQYRLRVDRQWRDHAQARKRVPNPYGSENCVLVVS